MCKEYGEIMETSSQQLLYERDPMAIPRQSVIGKPFPDPKNDRDMDIKDKPTKNCEVIRNLSTFLDKPYGNTT